MEKLFLVKKDINSKKENDEWITMNLLQFKKFIKSNEGKGRYFLKIEDDIGGQSPRIYCEVDKRQYKKFLIEKRHKQYINDMKKEYAYEIVSYQNLELSDGCTGEEVITDGFDFSNDLIFKILLDKIAKNLLPEEKWLLKELVLSDEPKSCRALSIESGIPQKTLNNRKRKLFEKIKKYIK